MFVRKRINKSGSTSIQIVDKTGGKYTLVEHIGTSSDESELEYLLMTAKSKIPSLLSQTPLFPDIPKPSHLWFNRFKLTSSIRIGYLEVFGKLFDEIGYQEVITTTLLKYITIARIIYPKSKLTLQRLMKDRLGFKSLFKDQIYRLMDTLDADIERQVCDLTYNFFKQVIGEKIHMIFFDATTLHFETFESDSLRKTGFSKVGKHNQPQIVIGLMVTQEGLPIGYDVFPGNEFDGHTIRAAIKRTSRRYETENVIFVADSSMFSTDNVEMIESSSFTYIMSARIKNMSRDIEEQILDYSNYHDNFFEIELRAFGKDKPGKRLVVTYSQSRARKDAQKREDEIKQLRKSLTKREKVTRSKMGKIGRTKFLKIYGDAHVDINNQAVRDDVRWDGLKGYVTNIHYDELDAKQVVSKYTQLWEVENAFRVSKTDLSIRPIYHYKRQRIRAHILIVFMGLAISRYAEYKLKPLKITTKRLIESLDSVQLITLTDERLNQNFQLKPPLSDTCKAIYRALEIDYQEGVQY